MTPWFDYPTFSWPERHAIVIGAGIAGCQMTWHLSQLGWRVTLLERECEIGTQASGNLAGVISPKMTSQDSNGEQFYRDAFNYTTQQLERLLRTVDNASTGIMWKPCGMLQLAHNDRELQRWESLKQRNLDPEFIQLLDQGKTSEIAGIPCDYPASYFPRAGYINPTSFCAGLLSASYHQLIHTCDITWLHRDNNDSWKVFDNNGKLIAESPVVIICSGKDINGFVQSDFIPQAAVLGQTTLATTTEGNQAPNCVIGHEGYLTPTYKGVNVFGATFDRQFENIVVTEESDQRNFSQLQHYLPAYSSTISALKSGHAAARCTTPDRYPYVGGIPEPDYFRENYQDLKHGRTKQAYPPAQYQSGLFLLGGFGSRGLTTSGYCANLLSQLIENLSNTGQRQLFDKLHPARFLIRHLKRGIIG